MAVVIAYDMHLECCEGNLDSSWTTKDYVDFHRFREKLGMQMLASDPQRRQYHGEEKFRVHIQQNAHQRRRSTSPVRSIQSTDSGVSEGDFL